MKNIILLILYCTFIVGCAHFSNVSPAQNDIWVALSYDRGGSTEEISAKLEKSIFNKITSGTVNRGWLEIDTAYWTKCGKKIPAVYEGAEWGYGNKYIIKIESIKRIVPLSDQAIRSIEYPVQSMEQGGSSPDTKKPCQ